ncbi:DNA-binding regulatory protein, YebC/PmpR family [Allopseudospirillum japonicum]|uniref:Probable transcriptional regulatory protein SAMN05421831_10920 n=1 Tax=Allopseudospirillum japonicum TaxID=64971 RepID=A0A1H6T2W0_9GAMM|nr:YebC/PmpR family DNA-binding transcriptional regulator [Allopseudospirillum japonicum]SEI74381.1 DNA-binding regulatory protein, YebC/PmpR family [Allopseudospirillum japonicum]
MAGHSKWANIKHRKAAQDAKRGKVFTKLIRELTVAAKQGGGIPEDNPRLRAAIDKALSNNMTKDTIQRAIDRGAGNSEADNMEEIVYEGYAPAGVAVLVECLSDNRNRTVSEVRHAFSKCGGNLGTSGSVAYLFNQRGQISFAPGVDEDALMEAALEAGAEDILTHDDASVDVLTSPQDFGIVKDALDQAGFQAMNAEVTKLPDTHTQITDLDTAQKVMRLIDMLEDLDDVQNVYTNADFAEELMDQL